MRLAGSHPRFAGWGLAAAEAWLDGPREVAVVGDPADPATAALRRTALLLDRPGVGASRWDRSGPTTRCWPGRPLVAGVPAAYVCRHFTCDAPVTDPAALRTSPRGAYSRERSGLDASL